MTLAGRYEIGLIGFKSLMFFTYKHLYLTLYDNAALVKGMLVAGVFLSLLYFHKHHNHHQLIHKHHNH